MILSWNPILGINARNAHISRNNPKEAIRLVNNKQETKQVMESVGNPVPPTLHFITDRLDFKRVDLAGFPDEWVVKPNKSLGGNGVMLAVGRDEEDGWKSASGKPISSKAARKHIQRILDGDYSPGARDEALVEPLLRPHDMLKPLAPVGLPDIRVICHGDQPIMAMCRLPTFESGGRANLHQGGVGASIDINTGVIDGALHRRTPIDTHPDTGHRLEGTPIPYWGNILEMSARCAAATGLAYLGADIVIDETYGPVMLEVNARPGLEIQNVNRLGLFDAILNNSRRL